MATLNIPRDVTDPFYRYKMERLQSKIEGKGNGIKTVVVNLSSVAASLERPPNYLIKYFGFELGAQTNIDPSDDRWIINGAHEASKLQDYLDGFISKFVLCKKCKNPETDVKVKDGDIRLDCKACGERSNVDLRLKLSSFILKHEPKKSKKDKSTKKAERRARKEKERAAGNGENGQNSDGSPDGSQGNSDQGEDNAEVEQDAGSDDEFTRRINEEAQGLNQQDEKKDIEWTVDVSEEAIKARAKGLPDDLQRSLAIADEEEEGGAEGRAEETLGNWIGTTAQEKGGLSKLENIDIYKKAQELGIEKKHRTLTVLAQTMFDENIVRQIDNRAPMLKKMITGEKHEKALLGGTERLVGITYPNLTASVPTILMKYYENDLTSEETLKAWGSKASKRYVDMPISKKVRKSAEKFMTWLETAESDDSDEE